MVDGGVMFRGRAVETLTGNLPTRPWRELCECPWEDLEAPSRVHVDPYGHVHICQGISMGNMWERPLSEIPLTGLMKMGNPQRVHSFQLFLFLPIVIAKQASD